MERGSDPPDGFTAGARGIRIGARVCDPKLMSLAVLGIRDCRREGLAVPGSPEKGAGYWAGWVVREPSMWSSSLLSPPGWGTWPCLIFCPSQPRSLLYTAGEFRVSGMVISV